MPSWKKLVTSGSNAVLNHVTASGNISGSSTSTGSFGHVITNRVQTSTLSGKSPLIIDADNLKLNASGTLSGSSASTASFGILKTANDFIVDSNGRVGINTTSPDYKLDVAGNIGMNEYLYHNGDSDTYIQFMDDRIYINAGGDSVIDYDEDATSTLKLAGGGEADVTIGDSSTFFVGGSQGSYDAKVGIGTTSPGELLDVAGDIRVRGAGGSIGGTTIGNAALIIGSTTNGIGVDANELLKKGGDLYFGLIDADDIYFRANSATTMFIDGGTGNVGIGETSPAEKLDVAGSIRINNGGYIDTGATPYEVKIGDNSTTTQYGWFSIKGALDGTTGLRVYPRDEAASISTYAHFSYNGASNYTMIGNASDKDAIVINTSGYVGIGTTSPDLGLHVNGAGNSGRIKLQQTTAADYSLISYVTTTRQWNVGVGGNAGVASLQNNFFFQDVTSGLNSLILSNTTGDAIFGGDVSGSASSTGSFGAGFIDNKLGIGTTSPETPLHVNGSIFAGSSGHPGVGYANVLNNFNSYIGLQLKRTGGGTSNFFRAVDSSDNIKFAIESDGTVFSAGNLTSTGNVSGSATSTGSFGHLVIGDNSTTFKNLNIQNLNVAQTVSASMFHANMSSDAGSPEYSFGQDPDTGMYSGGANVLGFSTGGTVRFTLTSAAFSSQTTGGARITPTNGVAAGPAFTFNDDADTGMFRPAANQLGFSTGGSERFRINANGNIIIAHTAPAGMANSSYKQIALNNGAVIADSGGTNSAFMLLQNSYVGASNNNYYTVGSKASRIMMTTGDISFATAGAGSADGQITWNTRMFIEESNGNVGIGVTDPDSKLEVQGSDLLANFGGTNAGFYIRNNTANYISFQGYGSDGFIFKDGGNERVRIEADGDVGIGTSSPGRKLEVSSGGADSPMIRASYDSNNYLDIKHDVINAVKSSGENLNLQTGGTTAIHIDASQNVGIGTSSPNTLLSVSAGTSGDVVPILSLQGHRTGNHPYAKLSFWHGSDEDTAYIMAHRANSNDSSADITFNTANNGTNAEVMRVTYDNNVGIGTSSPGSSLDVAGEIRGQKFAFNDDTNTHIDTFAADQIGFTLGGNSAVRWAFVAGAVTQQFMYGASATYPSYTFQSDQDTGMYLATNGAIGFSTGGSERMRINSTGLGIGVSNPTAKLHVDGDAIVTGKITAQEFHTEFVSASIVFESGSTKFGDTNDDLHQFTGSVSIQRGDDVSLKLMKGSNNVAFLGDVGSSNDGGLILYNENGALTTLLRTRAGLDSYINSTGNFGFGTNSPANKIHITHNNSDEYDTSAYASAILRLDNTNTSATQPHNLIHFRLDKNGGDGYLGFIAGGASNEEHFILGNQVDGEILRAASGGNVGIGTTSPTQKLEVSGNILLPTAGTHKLMFTNSAVQIDRTGGHLLRFEAFAGYKFQVNGSEKMSIDSSGNVGIGETSPDEALHITSTAASATPVILLENSNANNLAPQLNLYKNSASPASGDYAGQIDFEGNDSADNRTQYARIIAEATTVTNLIEDGILDLQVARDGSLTTGLRLRGMSGGAFVGIGETNPESPLHIKKASAGSVTANANSVLTLEDDGTNVLQFLSPSDQQQQIRFGDTSDDGAGILSYNHSTNAMAFATAGPIKMTLDSVGRLGIGDTSPDAILDVDNSNSTGTTVMHLTDSGGTGAHTMLQMNNTGGAVSTFNITGNDLQINATADLVLQNSGANVGIGTASPTRKLQVNASSYTEAGGADANIHFSVANSTWSGIGIFGGSSQGGFIDFGDTDATHRGRILYSHASDYMAFNTSATEKVRITSGGLVGIGQTSPAQILHLERDDADVAIAFTQTGQRSYHIGIDNSNSDRLTFGRSQTVGSSPIMTLDENLRVGIGTISPDYTLDVAGNIGVNGVIVHNDDPDTYIQFATNLISFYTGNSGNASNVEITKNLLHVSASANSLTQDILKVDNTVMNRALHLGLTDGNSSIQAKLTNGTTNTLLIQPSGSTTQFGGNVSGSATSTGSFGRLEGDGSGLTGVTATAGAAGSIYNVQYNSNGSATGGSNNFVFRDNKVGIGTNNPSTIFHINADTNSSNEVFIDNSGTGKTGITLRSDQSTDGNVNAFINFDGADDSDNNARYATIESFIVDNTDGTEDGRLTFSTMAGGTDTETMHVVSGRVGIGTSSPSYPLTVSKTESAASDFQTNLDIKRNWTLGTATDRLHGLVFSDLNSINAGIFVNRANSASNYNSSLHFYTNAGSSNMTPSAALTSTPKMSITSTGNVAIGVTSTDSNSKFQVEGSNATTQDYVFRNNHSTAPSRVIVNSNDTGVNAQLVADAGNSFAWVGSSTGGTNRIVFPAGTNGYFEGGNFGIGTTSPSEKLEVAGGVAFSGTATMTEGNDFGKATIDTDGTDRMRFHINGTNNAVYGGYEFRQSKGDHSDERLVMLIDETGNVGMGISIPDGKLHVSNGLAGAVTANADADELVIENSGNAGISILTPDTSNGAIFFGDTSDNNIGIIDYDHNVNQLSFTVAAVKAMTINASRYVGIGTTSPDEKLHVDGNIKATGDVIAENFIVKSTVTQMTQSFSSGSTIFGDTQDDTHQFTGSLVTSGSVNIRGEGQDKINLLGSANQFINFGDAADHNNGFIRYDHNNEAMSFAVGATDHLKIQTTGHVGIVKGGNAANTATEGTLHVHTATAGTVSAASVASDLIVENSDHTGISILSPDDKFGTLGFGSPSDSIAAMVRYDETNKRMILGTVEGTSAGNLRFVVGNETTAATIDSSGNFGIGTTSPSSYDSGGNNLVIYENGHSGITIASGTSSNGSIHFADGTTGNESYRGIIAYSHSSEVLQFATIGANNGYQLKLDQNSKISLSNNDGGTDNTVFGKLAGNALTTNGDENVLIGHEAGNDITTGKRNVVIGYQAGDKMTIATRSVAIGYGALGTEDVGDRSIAIGFNALSQQNSDSNNETTGNVGIGVEAGFYNVTGQFNTLIGTGAGLGASGQNHSQNTAVGYSALNVVTTGGSNVAVGMSSLRALTSGTENVSIGKDSMYDNNTGAGNTAVGTEALANNTSGGENVAIGKIALYTNTTTGANTALGYTALRFNTAANNTAVGHSALYNNSSGTLNVGIGTSAGYHNQTGNYNTYLGGSAGAGASGQSHTGNTGIGYKSLFDVTTANYNTALGNLAMENITTGGTNVGIGSRALGTLTTGIYNVAIGGDAMYAVPAGQAVTGVVAIGTEAAKGDSNTTTGINYSVAIGQESLKYIRTGARNVAVGYRTLGSLTAGSNNTAVGHEALYTSVDGTSNTAVGRKALYTFEGGSDAGENTAVGALSALSLTTGVGNTSIGKQALCNATTAGYNTAIGVLSMGLGVATAASGYNTAIGAQSLYDITSGTSNVALGAEAGVNITTGHQNTIVGRQALATATNSANIVAVGLYAGLRINSSVADGSVLIGRSAGENITNGARNTAVGYNAMLDSVGAGDNAVFGYEALKEGTTSEQNVAVGSYSLGANSAAALTGNANTALGYKSQYVAQGTANSNTSVGGNSLLALTTGIQNVAVGTGAAGATTVGQQITAIGAYAMSVGNAGNYNTAVGNQSLTDVTGAANVAMGFQTAFNLTSGDYNVAIGHHSMGLGTVTGDHNVAVGHGSGYDLTSGEGNVFTGRSSGANVTTGIGNVLLGDQAGMSLVSGHNNIIIGREAGKNVTTTIQKNVIVGYGAGNGVLTTAADGLVAIGATAGAAITSGAANTVIGFESGKLLTTGASNVSVGYQAMGNAHLGSEKNVMVGKSAFFNGEVDEAVFIGFNAGGDGTTTTAANGAVGVGKSVLNSLTSAQRMTAVGYQALAAEDAGGYQTAVGYQALAQVNNDNGHNVALGQRAGYTLTGGYSNTLIGSATNASSVNGVNQTVIGMGATGVADNSVTLGGSSVTAIYAAQDSGATIYAAGLVEGSSMTLKENIAEIESPLDKLTKLRGVEFDYKSTKERSIGMIAEEVNEVFPELVNKNEDGEVTAMSYSRMTAVLLEAVKELSQEVKDSREEIRELKKLNNYSKAGDKN